MENMEDKNKNQLSIIESISLESAQETMNKINGFHAIVKSTLIPNIDYGMIPGATKPMLFKSGAENILMLFGLFTTVDIIAVTPEELTKDTDFLSYTVKCCLIKNNEIVSQGLGTCNSSEKKYIKKSPLDVANTILKMASKRALVDAVLHVASLSSLFAQETEEMSDYLKTEDLENLSVADASNYKLKFGKHKGLTAGEVYKNHFDYVRWFYEKGKDEKLLKVFEILSNAIKQQKNKVEGDVDADDNSNSDRNNYSGIDNADN